MERADELSDLCALQELYKLLDKTEDNDIDEKARLLLKNLLDAATKRALKTQMKVEEIEVVPKLQVDVVSNISRSPSSIPIPRKDSNLHATTSQKDEQPHARQIFPEIVLERTKPDIFSAEQCNMTPLNLEETHKEAPLFEEGGNLLCQQYDHLKIVHGNSGYGTFSGLIEMANHSVKTNQRPGQKLSPSVVSSNSVVCPMSFQKQEAGFHLASHIEEKLNERSDVSEEISNSIKGLQSGRSTWLLYPEIIKNTASQHGTAHSVNSPIQNGLGKINGGTKIGKSVPSQRTRKVMGPTLENWMVNPSPELTSVERNASLCQIAGQKGRSTSQTFNNDPLSQLSGQIGSRQILGQKLVKAVHKIESQNQRDRQSNTYVCGLRVPENMDDRTKGPPMLVKMHSQIITGSPASNQMEMAHNGTTKRVASSRTTLGEGYVTSTKPATKPAGSNRPAYESRKAGKRDMIEKKSKRQHDKFVRPTLLDHRHNDQESRETSSSSQYRSSTTSYSTETSSSYQYQSSTASCSENEDTVAQKGTTRKLASSKQNLGEGSTASTNPAYKPVSSTRAAYKPSKAGKRGMIDTKIMRQNHMVVRSTLLGNKHNEQELTKTSSSFQYQSSTASYSVQKNTKVRIPNVKQDESSSQQSSSSYSYSDNSGNKCISKAYKQKHAASQEKKIGRLRRLKNKLGLIFHHHHHHHTEDEFQNAEAGHHKSMWKHLQGGFHTLRKQDPDSKKEKALGKKRGAVNVVQNKNQNGHFHMLVQRLMKHVGQSKKSKTSKGGVGRGPKHGRNNVHWYKMLRSKNGVKMGHRRHLKLGLRATTKMTK